MLLIYKYISHVPIAELENNAESVWVKVFANKTSHFVARWYRPPDDTLEQLEKIDLLYREQLDEIKNKHKSNTPVHFLGDFNFRYSVWPDRLNKSGSALSPKLVDIMNDRVLEQLVHFPTREKKTHLI